MSQRILGIDPGINGYLACIGSQSIIQTKRMPLDRVTVNGKEKNKVSATGLAEAVREMAPNIAVVEDVFSSPQMGVVSAFSFGEGKGAIAGVLAALGVPVIWVAPATWKAKLNLSADKELSKKLASKLFPLHKVKSHDEAEAILLAYYGVNLLLHASKSREKIEARPVYKKQIKGSRRTKTYL